MSSKVNFRERVLIVISALTVVACAGLTFTSIKSLQLDREYLSLVEHSKNTDLEVSHSRIFLDDYILFKGTLKEVDIL